MLASMLQNWNRTLIPNEVGNTLKTSCKEALHEYAWEMTLSSKTQGRPWGDRRHLYHVAFKIYPVYITEETLCALVGHKKRSHLNQECVFTVLSGDAPANLSPAERIPNTGRKVPRGWEDVDYGRQKFPHHESFIGSAEYSSLVFCQRVNKYNKDNLEDQCIVLAD